jgi:putative amino-acid transport system permease protein
MNLNFVLEVFKSMLPALPKTLWISFLSFILAVGLALFVTIVDYYQLPVLNKICNLYVSFFRGTPLLAQLFLFYFGLPSLSSVFMSISKFEAVILGLSFNAGAYMRETFRGAILSVDTGQIEAAYSVGLSDMQTMYRIILPQSIVVAIPSLVNNLVDIIKGSSLAFTVGIVDITAVAKLKSAANFKYFEGYLAVMILYWIIILVLEKGQIRLENYLSKNS